MTDSHDHTLHYDCAGFFELESLPAIIHHGRLRIPIADAVRLATQILEITQIFDADQLDQHHVVLARTALCSNHTFEGAVQ